MPHVPLIVADDADTAVDAAALLRLPVSVTVCRPDGAPGGRSTVVRDVGSIQELRATVIEQEDCADPVAFAIQSQPASDIDIQVTIRRHGPWGGTATMSVPGGRGNAVSQIRWCSCPLNAGASRQPSGLCVRRKVPRRTAAPRHSRATCRLCLSDFPTWSRTMLRSTDWSSVWSPPQQGGCSHTRPGSKRMGPTQQWPPSCARSATCDPIPPLDCLGGVMLRELFLVPATLLAGTLLTTPAVASPATGPAVTTTGPATAVYYSRAATPGSSTGWPWTPARRRP